MCRHYHDLTLEPLCHPRRKLHLQKQSLPHHLTTTDPPSFSVALTTLDSSCKWIHTVWGLCIWLFSFSVMFPRFIPVACITASFLSMTEQCSIIWINVVYPAEEICIYPPFFAIINNSAMNIDICAYLWTYVSILSSTYLGMELLAYLIILCLTFWESLKLFFTVAEPFYILITMFENSI